MNVELLQSTSNIEELIEKSARVSYKSRMSSSKESRRKFIRALLSKGHVSVLEHASASVRLSGVSRALTHQLVRHRLCSYTQLSQRKVDESRFECVIPKSIDCSESAREVFDTTIHHIQEAYCDLIDLGIPKEDARFLLPNATASEIVITANLRQWRHLLRQRGHPDAQWEIRMMSVKILELLKEIAPVVFEDLEVVGNSEIVARQGFID